MASDNVFGLLEETPEGEPDPFGDEVVPEPDSAPAIEETPAEEAPEVGTDPLAAPETPAEAEPALDEAEIEPEAPVGTPYAGRYAEKYATLEAMEEAHRNALALAQRQAEHAKEVETQLQQATGYLQAAAQYIEEQEKAKTATPPQDLTKKAAELGYDEEALKVFQEAAERAAEQKFAPLQQQFEQQQQAAELAQQQAYADAQAAQAKSQIDAFRTRAELAGGDEDNMVVVFNEFGLDPTVSENYDIALEAAKNPRLHSILRANPNYIDTDDGMDLARQLAGVHSVVTTPTNDPNALAAARKRATVESGASGAAPVGESKPRDEWDDVLDVAREGRTKSVFGV